MNWICWAATAVIALNIVFFGVLYAIFLIEKRGVKNGDRKTDR